MTSGATACIGCILLFSWIENLLCLLVVGQICIFCCLLKMDSLALGYVPISVVDCICCRTCLVCIILSMMLLCSRQVHSTELSTPVILDSWIHLLRTWYKSISKLICSIEILGLLLCSIVWVFHYQSCIIISFVDSIAVCASTIVLAKLNWH